MTSSLSIKLVIIKTGNMIKYSPLNSCSSRLIFLNLFDMQSSVRKWTLSVTWQHANLKQGQLTLLNLDFFFWTKETISTSYNFCETEMINVWVTLWNIYWFISCEVLKKFWRWWWSRWRWNCRLNLWVEDRHNNIRPVLICWLGDENYLTLTFCH